MKIYTYKDDEHYRKEQEKANKKKLDKIWVQESTIEKIYFDFGKNCKAILCHGTRNAAEQKYFQKYYPNADIIGTEISKTAQEFNNTVQWDFRQDNKSWHKKFDILYSNSFDHTNMPRETLVIWRNQIKPNGIMYIEYCFSESNNKSRKSDPLELTRIEFEDLLEQSNLSIIKIFDAKGPFANDKSILFKIKK